VRGHSVGCGSRLAVRGGCPHRRDARGKVCGVVPWPEVPVCGEALLDDNSGAWWLAVGFERRPMIQGGGPSSGGARGDCLGAARLAVAGTEACGATVWWCGRARHGAPWQLRAGVRERGENIWPSVRCERIRVTTSMAHVDGKENRAVANQRRRREVASGGRASAASPQACGHVLAGTCGHGPAWAAGKRAVPLL
jgi:hypothetical protein